MNGSAMKENYVNPQCDVHVLMLENTILESSNESVEEKNFTW